LTSKTNQNQFLLFYFIAADSPEVNKQFASLIHSACISPISVSLLHTQRTIAMHPYVFNPYTLAAANLAHYNAATAAAVSAANNASSNATTATANNGSASTPTQTVTPNAVTTGAAATAYAFPAPMAANPALAQAAALTAYRNMAAIQQQQLNGMVALNSLNPALPNNGSNGDPLNTANHDLDNGVVAEEQDDEEDAMETEVKNKKNKLYVEHDGFYNMKPLLAENILSSDYFKSLYRFKTYHEVIDEATRFCKNVEPLMVGLSRKPSTAFCILYKFFSMELTVRQVQGLLDYEDNAFVRALGFLYLRYLLPAKDLWKWVSPYFDDEQEFSPGADGKVVKIREFVEGLLQNQKYFSTLLPRIPVKIERAYKKRLLQRELIKKRDLENETIRDQLAAGMEIRAQWQDLKWYNATIDECLEDGKFLVTFLEYGDQYTVSIGQIQLKKKQSASRSASGARSRSRSRSVSSERHRHSSRRHRDRDGHRERHRDRERRHRKRKRSVSSSRSVSSGASRSGSASRSRSRSRSRSHSNSKHRSSKSRHKSSSSRHGHHSHHHRSSKRHSSSRHDDRHKERSKKRDTKHHAESNGLAVEDVEMNDDRELEEMVRKKEMEACVAIGRDYARRPTAYYHSLTLHLETGTNRKRSPTPPAASLRSRKSKKKASNGQSQVAVKKVTSKPPSRQHLEKMRLLKQRYGDAASSK